MSLRDFYFYIEEIIEKNKLFFYVRRKHDSIFVNELITKEILTSVFSDYQIRYSNFFISTEPFKINQQNFSFYDDSLINYIIEGEGGRENEEKVEIIALRLLSKKPEKLTKSVFNSIKNTLEKDDSIGKGLKASNSFYKDYYYLKSYIGNKEMSFDFYNDKLPPLNCT